VGGTFPRWEQQLMTCSTPAVRGNGKAKNRSGNRHAATQVNFEDGGPTNPISSGDKNTGPLA